jgi:hypothetical protein
LKLSATKWCDPQFRVLLDLNCSVNNTFGDPDVFRQPFLRTGKRTSG